MIESKRDGCTGTRHKETRRAIPGPGARYDQESAVGNINSSNFLMVGRDIDYTLRLSAVLQYLELD